MTGLLESIAHQVRRSPDQVALSTTTGAISYADLDRLSNRIAAWLIRQRGPSVESVAALLTDPIEQAAAVLGVAKAGKCYVPIDPAFPDAQVSFIARDAEVRLVIVSRSAGASRLAGLPLLGLDTLSEPADALPDPPRDPDDLWIVYTSGSTGHPKGLLQSHRNLFQYMQVYRDAFSIQQGDVLTSAFSLQVNGGLHDLLISLTNGIPYAPWQARRDGFGGLSRWLADRQTTILSMVPTAFRAWMDHVPPADLFPGIRMLRFWGEGSFRRDFERFQRHFPDSCILVNRLGSSETGPVCWNFLRRNDSFEGVRIPVGYAAPHHTVWIEDENGNRLPPGETGEIVVRSAYIFPGYWKREEQTRAVLSADPDVPGEQIYRTSDLGYFLPNGQLVAAGRKGKMVKIRGYLVALDEAEQALASHPAVRDAAVSSVGDVDDDQRLVGYYVPRSGATASSNGLRAHMRSLVPDHLVPAAFVRLDSLPLAPNGKVARHELPPPPPVRPDFDYAYVAPETPAQKAVAQVWEEVLGLRPVGLDDDFLDLGGSSLRASRVLVRLNALLGIDLALALLLDNPTVRKLALQIPGPSEKHRIAASRVLPPLVRRSAADPVLASSAQRRLWFLDQLEGPSAVYHVARAWRVQGPLDLAAWRRALSEVVRRHESLRTVIAAKEGVPYQRIHPPVEAPLTVRDFQYTSADGRLTEAQAFLEAEAARPFRLDADLMLRAAVAVLGPAEHLLLVVIHHIACDGWSLDLFVKEAAVFYEAPAGSASLPDLPVQYADYSQWQQTWLASGSCAAEMSYWRERLEDVPRLDFPLDFPRPAKLGAGGEREPLRVPPAVVAAVRECGQTEGATEFMVTLAAYLVLLWRHTGAGELAVGVPTAGRPVAALESLIGFFVNTLVLRVGLEGNLTFRELIVRVRTRSIEALSNQSIPFEQLVEELGPNRDPSHAPLFQTLFVLQDPRQALRLKGTEIMPLPVPTHTAKVDLSLMLEPEGMGYSGHLEYSTDLFRPETMRSVGERYARLLELLARNPDTPIGEVPILTPDERRRMFVEWNGPSKPYPLSSIVAVFEQRVEEYADSDAVISGTVRWTYRELNHRANRIARGLLAVGVRRGHPVAMLMDRSPESVAAMLGILKSGAGYLPLDPNDPPDRLRFQLLDSACAAVVGLASGRGAFDVLTVPISWIDLDTDEIARQSPSDPDFASGPDDLAYINYTSGTTGTPKGVLIPHRAVLRLLFHQQYAHFSPDETFVHMAPLPFDATTLEVWGSLLHGGRCVVWEGSPALTRDFSDFLRGHDVTIAWITASLFNAILEETPEALAGLRQVLTGGEPVSLPHIRRASELLPGVRIVNGYGPTEATVFTCCQPIPRPIPESWRSVPIGRPLANTLVFILDQGCRPVLPLVPGELCIGGDGLAIGYLNRPELDAEKFIEVNIAGKLHRLYRSGDRARWLPSGILEFLGRFDDQVKIRGYRVELGEIEAAFAGHPDVKAASVQTARSEDGTHRIVAHVARRPGIHLEADAIAAFLTQRLPAYMVPTEITVFDELPLARNGKTQRVRPAVSAAPRGVEPSGETEMRLAGLWAELLGIESVPRDRSFFDLGGHSLLAMKLLAAVEREFGMRISVASMFETPTLAEMASALPREGSRKSKQHTVPIQPNGGLPPFFCVGAWPLFRPLALGLGSDRPFLGLTAAIGPGDVAHNLEELAADLAAVIRARQSQGPYFVGGWCIAGVLAYEIARQLENSGEEVGLVAMFDTPNPEARRAWFAEAPRRRWLGLMWSKSLYHLREALLEEPVRVPRYLWDRLLGGLEHARLFRDSQRFTQDNDQDQDNDALSAFEKGLDALAKAYRPMPIRARVVQFRPARRPRGSWLTDGLGWEQVTSRLEVVDVPGQHTSMFTGREVSVLAAELKQRLDQAGALQPLALRRAAQ